MISPPFHGAFLLIYTPKTELTLRPDPKRGQIILIVDILILDNI